MTDTAEVSIRLPNEILVKIFSYLPSQEILRLYHNSESKEFRAILTNRDVIKFLDLCSEGCDIKPSELEKFIQAHSTQISALCLNYCGDNYLSKLSFSQIGDILTELHVKGCGFTSQNVYNFVLDLRSLKAFSWTVPSLRDCHSLFSVGDKVSECVNRLDIDIIHNEVADFILKWFYKITHLNIYIYRTYPAQGIYLHKHGGIWELSHLHTCTVMPIGNLGSMWHCERYRSMLDFIFKRRKKDLKWRVLEVQENCRDPKLKEMMSRGIPPARSSRVLFIAFIRLQDDNDAQAISKMCMNNAGNQLQQLKLVNCIILPCFMNYFFNSLHQLISMSQNLREINLTGTHLCGTQIERTILDVISEAHGLQRLAVPPCLIIPFEDQVKPVKRRKMDFAEETGPAMQASNSSPKELPLEKLAKNCPHLLELDIRRRAVEYSPCFHDSSVREQHLEPILMMSRLEDLSLMNLSSVASLDFLRSLPVKCPRLKTLRLSDLGPFGQRRYLQNLFHALPLLSNLQELSLQHSMFQLDHEECWIGLAALPTLKRFCIITQCERKLYAELIIRYLHSVPTIRTFHIHSRSTGNESCKQAVLRTLNDNSERPPADFVIENINFKAASPLSGDFYVCQRMCYKFSTVGIPIGGCGL